MRRAVGYSLFGYLLGIALGADPLVALALTIVSAMVSCLP